MVANRKLKRLKYSSKKTQRDYDLQKYWDDRYAAKLKGESLDEDADDTDEWYFSYSDISDILKSYIKQSHRHSSVLDIGCGLSKIFDELSNDHFTGPFVGIDYSSIVIKQCNKIKKNKNYYYLTLDMMQKQKPLLPINSFGLIIDKAATDGILCNKLHLSTISNMYEHASNLLSSNGIFIIITIRTVDDTEWFEDCLIPALIRGSENQQTKFIIHFHECMTYTDGTENGPNIFVIIKYDCKSYSLRSSTNETKQDVSKIVTVKCY
jgi:SAM-dependent methyltransferase